MMKHVQLCGGVTGGGSSEQEDNYWNSLTINICDITYLLTNPSYNSEAATALTLRPLKTFLNHI